ncbi:hypothetical protein A2V82_11290 [candidate division KSB1 bacterium RBG_16_48_16]|nr:MAG: hypothetical protein A2V82_11290 [candidate division KSB1 bacterium RBG_16_48_16]
MGQIIYAKNENKGFIPTSTVKPFTTAAALLKFEPDYFHSTQVIMFLKNPTPRKFEYQYRYYKPEQDTEKRVHFRRIRKSTPAQKGSVIRLAIILLILVFMFMYLHKKGGPSADGIQRGSDKIIVEDVIVVD